MATLPLKSSRNVQHAVVCFFMGKRTYHTLPYSPDSPPSDCHLIGPMKKMLGGQKFTSDTEVPSVVRQWLGQQPASFFTSGSQKLFERWDKCLNKLGRYVEMKH